MAVTDDGRVSWWVDHELLCSSRYRFIWFSNENENHFSALHFNKWINRPCKAKQMANTINRANSVDFSCFTFNGMRHWHKNWSINDETSRTRLTHDVFFCSNVFIHIISCWMNILAKWFYIVLGNHALKSIPWKMSHCIVQSPSESVAVMNIFNIYTNRTKNICIHSHTFNLTVSCRRFFFTHYTRSLQSEKKRRTNHFLRKKPLDTQCCLHNER